MAARTPRTMKSNMTTTCLPRNGGSDCVGARAFSGLLAVLAGTAATVCTAGEPCAMCETCNRLILRALRQVVGSTVGDVVQLVRTLPRLPRSSKRFQYCIRGFVRQNTQSHKFSSHSKVTGLSTSYSFKTHFGFWREPETTLIIAMEGWPRRPRGRSGFASRAQPRKGVLAAGLSQ